MPSDEIKPLEFLLSLTSFGNRGSCFPTVVAPIFTAEIGTDDAINGSMITADFLSDGLVAHGSLDVDLSHSQNDSTFPGVNSRC